MKSPRSVQTRYEQSIRFKPFSTYDNVSDSDSDGDGDDDDIKLRWKRERPRFVGEVSNQPLVMIL